MRETLGLRLCRSDLPPPEAFRDAVRKVLQEAHACVFVGDSPLHDIGGAKAVGIRAVLTQQYIARPCDGFEPQPDAVIGHLRELQAVIERFDARGI